MDVVMTGNEFHSYSFEFCPTCFRWKKSYLHESILVCITVIIIFVITIFMIIIFVIFFIWFQISRFFWQEGGGIIFVL